MGSAKTREAVVAVLAVDPGLDREAAPRGPVVHREAGDAEHVEPGGDRDRLPPVGQAPAVAEVGLLDQQAVRHDLVVGRGGHQHLGGGLVVGMVERGQPLPRLDRPVVAEEGPLAVLVVRDQQAGRGDAAVAHDERAPLARAARGLEADREAVVRVLERPRRAALGHGAHRHALVGGCRASAARGPASGWRGRPGRRGTRPSSRPRSRPSRRSGSAGRCSGRRRRRADAGRCPHARERAGTSRREREQRRGARASAGFHGAIAYTFPARTVPG